MGPTRGCFCFNSKQWATHIVHCVHVTLFMLINSHEQCNMHTVPVGPVPAKPVPVRNLKYIESGSTQ